MFEFHLCKECLSSDTCTCLLVAFYPISPPPPPVVDLVSIWVGNYLPNTDPFSVTVPSGRSGTSFHQKTLHPTGLNVDFAFV